MYLIIVLITLLPLITPISCESSDPEVLEAINAAVIENSQRAKKKDVPDAPVCYEDIDCFIKNGPMKHIGTQPASPAKINTRFFAYTRIVPKIGQELIIKSPKSLSVVASEQPLAVIIHGFANDANKIELIALKDSLIKFAGVPTVIMVDWSKGALSPWYAEAATNTQVVGRQIAFLINTLRMNRRINPFSIHLLGYSLGAHIAGFAGKFSQNKYNWKFGRITALDAAGPLFEGFAGAYLSKDDANFVDAIHTSGGVNILKGEVGFSGPFGVIDFYPNNGTRQPRCQKQTFLSACDHSSSVYYMESSLRANSNCSLVAFKCNSWDDFASNKCEDRIGAAIMGYMSVLTKSFGSHYLRTTDKYPFCWDSRFRRKIKKTKKPLTQPKSMRSIWPKYISPICIL